MRLSILTLLLIACVPAVPDDTQVSEQSEVMPTELEIQASHSNKTPILDEANRAGSKCGVKVDRWDFPGRPPKHLIYFPIDPTPSQVDCFEREIIHILEAENPQTNPNPRP